MRDTNRIKPLLEQLHTIWTTMPDLRLCQLLTIVVDSNRKQSKIITDLFYVKDEEIKEALAVFNEKINP